jgi:hypothetical protein
MTGSFRVKRSGGPRTEKGKAVAAGNSLKTGIYAATVVMADESEKDFLELRDSLLVELGASGVLEAALVHELAVITWKKARLDRLEHQVVMQRLNAPVTPEDYFEGGLSRTPENEWILARLDSLTIDLIEEIGAKEALARQLISFEDRESAIVAIEEHFPALFDQLITWVRDESDPELSQGVDMLALIRERKHAANKGNFLPLIGLLGVGLGYKILEECRRYKRGIELLPKIEAIKGQIRDQRLANLIAAEGSNRAREDLNRSFFRVLKELRTQQEWRKKHEVIDVSPLNDEVARSS